MTLPNSIFGFILLFVIGVLIYSTLRVQKQREEIRDQGIDAPWEIPEDPWTPELDATALDEWDREYLAGGIDEAEWKAEDDGRSG